jgi:methylthioribose-1-phosphate isomerase
MSTWIKIWAIAIAAAALFLGGYRFAAALYQSDIDAMKADHALALADKEKEARANERKQTEALSAAWEEVERQKADLAQSRADSGNLRIELERVRVQSDHYRKRLSAASASSCKHFAERLDRCVGLLEEGSGLSEEGASLSQRVSGKHDALAKMHQ